MQWAQVRRSVVALSCENTFQCVRASMYTSETIDSLNKVTINRHDLILRWGTLQSLILQTNIWSKSPGPRLRSGGEFRIRSHRLKTLFLGDAKSLLTTYMISHTFVSIELEPTIILALEKKKKKKTRRMHSFTLSFVLRQVSKVSVGPFTKSALQGEWSCQNTTDQTSHIVKSSLPSKHVHRWTMGSETRPYPFGEYKTFDAFRSLSHSCTCGYLSSRQWGHVSVLSCITYHSDRWTDSRDTWIQNIDHADQSLQHHDPRKKLR